MRMKGKVCVVTGATRGIGRGIVETFAREGAARVWALDVNDSGFAELEKAAPCAKGAVVDVTDAKAVEELVARIKAEQGRIDVLVNNAGITKDGLLMRMGEADWDAVIATNLKSVFNFSKAAVRPMMSQRSGKIINVSSIAGVIGNPGQTNYAASKAGMIGFTKSLARELGSRNIQVNAIAPGFIDTDMTAALTADQKQKLEQNIPLKRTGKPEEIAGVACFLASAAADYMTGQVLCVDGGMVM
jgi:3-oxoacyl-[acyl-carrier protein] reductase